FGSDVRALQLANIPTGVGVNPGKRLNTRVANDFREPYTQGWSLGVQREITTHVALEVRDVGNRVNGNFQTVNPNPDSSGLVAKGFGSLFSAGVPPCATAGAPGTTPGFFGEATNRPDCNFSAFRRRQNSAWSTYNGLQSELKIRTWKGLSGGFSFTFS